MTLCGVRLGPSVAPLVGDGDIYPHVSERTCACGPDLTVYGDVWHFVHNAWDEDHGEGLSLGFMDADELWEAA